MTEKTNDENSGQVAGREQQLVRLAPITAEMIREMMGHLPLSITDPPEQWKWMADFLNETVRNPAAVCPCCNIRRDGELMDHLPSPPLPNDQGHQSPTPNS